MDLAKKDRSITETLKLARQEKDTFDRDLKAAKAEMKRFREMVESRADMDDNFKVRFVFRACELQSLYAAKNLATLVCAAVVLSIYSGCLLCFMGRLSRARPLSCLRLYCLLSTQSYLFWQYRQTATHDNARAWMSCGPLPFFVCVGFRGLCWLGVRPSTSSCSCRAQMVFGGKVHSER